MEDKVRISLCLAMCITLIVVSIFVWPTIYHYNKVTSGSHTIIVRINRFTGNAEVLIPGGGWTSWMDDNTTQSNKEPWNDKTITTIYEGLRVEQKGYLSFGYYIYNNSNTDYEIIGPTGLKLMVSLSDGSIAEDESLKTDMLVKLFLPSKMKQFITIHLEGLTIPASVNKNDVKAIRDYLNDKFINFNGFIYLTPSIGTKWSFLKDDRSIPGTVLSRFDSGRGKPMGQPKIARLGPPGGAVSRNIKGRAPPVQEVPALP